MVPDPGDDAYEMQRASAVEAVGARAPDIIAAGKALALGDAILRARGEIAGVGQ